MTEQEILDGNRLIAVFVGYEHDELEEVDDPTITYNCYNHFVNISEVEPWETSIDDWTSWLRVDEMQFHSSWDWLMPVIRKIINTIGNKSIDECTDIEWNVSTNITRMYIGLDIEVMWQLVINYIKWYNQNKTL